VTRFDEEEGMATSGGVWGIDIGQCALKALRCTVGPGNTVVAEAFDYIEYPKILNQPEAEPKQMIQEALTQFLSRNKVKGDKVCISVSGQSGLARFFKPPPVDAKKMPDLVKFEARQQIPFALEDVIWDWQTMGGATEVDGFALDTEVGLFAMKRDAVFRALEPFDEAHVEIDIVQLAPEAVYNFVAHDIIAMDAAEGGYDSENPPPSLAVLSMGTDTSDLVVTNGYRLWQRSIPIGGNHFTKQLSKELKLTFAKAEHLKRNARQAEDPKVIFQAMRSIFNDLVTETQRSLQFFSSVDRKATISGIALLGNAVKLPGLAQYLSKNLGLDAVHFEAFHKLTGKEVLASTPFKDNLLSFSVCYGLCLQGLGMSKLRTNLVPRELITERMIRAKKPWALASYAALLLACSVNFFFHYSAWSQVQVDTSAWKNAIDAAKTVKSKADSNKSAFDGKKTERENLAMMGQELTRSVERRMLWPEVFTAISESLPRTEALAGGKMPTLLELPPKDRKEIHIEHLEVQPFAELADWWKDDRLKQLYRSQIAANPPPATPAPQPPAQAQTPADPATPAPAPASEIPVEDPGPSGPGYVVEILGHHFYQNDDAALGGSQHVTRTLLEKLRYGDVSLPTLGAGGATDATMRFTMKELGIDYPVLVWFDVVDRTNTIPNKDWIEPKTGGENVVGGKDLTDPKVNPKEIAAPKFSFVVQFCFKPKPLPERLADRAKAAADAAAAATSGVNTMNTGL
jgi:type IV pilus assembly protein PilM